MLPYLRRSESMSIIGTNDVICRAIWRCLTSLPYQFSIFDDVVGWQPCITFKSSPWVQGAKCYIILAPAFQRLNERKIGTLKTGRLIESGRLVQGRSQGRVYISYVSKTLIFHSMHAQARQLLLLSTQGNISFRLRFQTNIVLILIILLYHIYPASAW